MAGLSVTTEATVDPVSTQEMRDFARLDDSIDTNFLNSFIKAATILCEEYTGRAFINRSLRLSIDGVEDVDETLTEGFSEAPFQIYFNNYLTLPKPPLVSVTSIKYFDDDDTESTWSSTNYYVDSDSQPARILLRTGGAWPTSLRKANGLQVNYTAGYGDSRADVPEAIRVAIMQAALNMYEHRGEDEKQGFGTGIKLLPIVANLLSPYVVRRLGITPLQSKYTARF